MKKIKFLLLLSMLILVYATQTKAQNTSFISLYLNDTQNLTVGDLLQVDITAQIAEPVHGFSFQLAYDPACLAFNEHEPGDLFAEALKAPVPQNDPGLADVVYTLVGDVPGVSGQGRMAVAHFSVLDTCPTTIHLQEVSLVKLDENGIAQRITDLTVGLAAVDVFAATEAWGETSGWDETQFGQAQEFITGGDGDGQGGLPTQISAPEQVDPGWEPAANPEVASPTQNTLPLDTIWLVSAGLLVAATLVNGLASVTAVRRPTKQPKTSKTRPGISEYPPPVATHPRPMKAFSVPTAAWHEVPCLISHQGESIYLTHDRFVIGRHPNCDLTLPEVGISRQHAEIIAKDGQYFVADMGSSNGTYLNGQPLGNRYQNLQDGDQLQLGKMTHFRFKTPEFNPVSNDYVVTQMQ